MGKRYRHRFGASEFLLIVTQGIAASARLIANRSVDEDAMERLRLTVTEVNGCDVCSYVHARMALRQGMDAEQVSALLGGREAEVPAAEGTAMLFAQHYAYQNGRPDREAWDALVSAYGKREAQAMVAAIQQMMLGNVTGLPMSAFLSRLRGEPYDNSPLAYELAGLVATLLVPLCLPLALFFHVRCPDHLCFSNDEEAKERSEGFTLLHGG
jgi:AhpD family alkylhydroperoxidase